MVTAHDAKMRRVVRLPDGKTGVLLHVPIPMSQRKANREYRSGAQAVVRLPGGSHRNCPPGDLTIVETEPSQAGVVADGYLCVCGHMSIDHHDDGPVSDPRASYRCSRCGCDALQEADS